MSLVERLGWDSDLFGFEIGRVAHGTGATALADAVREGDKRGLRCLYLLVPAADADLLELAQRLGFLVRDVRLEFRRPVEGHPANMNGLRRATQGDLAVLEPIARERFVTTRFFLDPEFPRDRSAELYVRWLRGGIEARAGKVTLIAGDGRGFITCRLDRVAGAGHIELIAVAADAERTGMAGSLMEGAGELFAEAGMRTALVVTQAANIAAQRLYQRYGYRTADAAVWLHRWREGHEDQSSV